MTNPYASRGRALHKTDLVAIWIVDACFTRSPALINRPLINRPLVNRPLVNRPLVNRGLRARHGVRAAQKKFGERAVNVVDDHRYGLTSNAVTRVAR